MKAKIFRDSEIDWIEAPGHYSAFSKMLVSEADGSKFFDFRVSSYQPKGYCDVHTHQTAENIYYILRGEGVVELDGEKHWVNPGMVIFVPAGVPHGIKNTGFEDLIFVVAASPPQDMPRPALHKQHGKE